jgi:hypothetical protein
MDDVLDDLARVYGIATLIFLAVSVSVFFRVTHPEAKLAVAFGLFVLSVTSAVLNARALRKQATDVRKAMYWLSCAAVLLCFVMLFTA